MRYAVIAVAIGFLLGCTKSTPESAAEVMPVVAPKAAPTVEAVNVMPDETEQVVKVLNAEEAQQQVESFIALINEMMVQAKETYDEEAKALARRSKEEKGLNSGIREIYYAVMRVMDCDEMTLDLLTDAARVAIVNKQQGVAKEEVINILKNKYQLRNEELYANFYSQVLNYVYATKSSAKAPLNNYSCTVAEADYIRALIENNVKYKNESEDFIKTVYGQCLIYIDLYSNDPSFRNYGDYRREAFCK